MNENIVYVLTEYDDDDGKTVHGVFSDPQKAMDFVNTFDKGDYDSWKEYKENKYWERNTRYGDYRVTEFEIDKAEI